MVPRCRRTGSRRPRQAPGEVSGARPRPTAPSPWGARGSLQAWKGLWREGRGPGLAASCSSRHWGGRCPCAVSRGEGGAGAQSSKARTSWLPPASARRWGCGEGAVGVRGGCCGPKYGGCACAPLYSRGGVCEHQDQKPLADWVREGAPIWFNSRLMTTKEAGGAGPTGARGQHLALRAQTRGPRPQRERREFGPRCRQPFTVRSQASQLPAGLCAPRCTVTGSAARKGGAP